MMKYLRSILILLYLVLSFVLSTLPTMAPGRAVNLIFRSIHLLKPKELDLRKRIFFFSEIAYEI